MQSRLPLLEPLCFLSEVEHLKEEGLIKGGNIDNAVAVDKKIDDAEAETLSKLFGLEKENKLGI